uniref:M48 family metallopeptidase n=1 Tax=Thaumasiovibrio occultus TaxID=1891184 RepID=UPI000B3575D1|nr:M48 family metallopeptidase [Thaumasiovibrio occultus]
MEHIDIYPPSPEQVPESLTRANHKYKRQAWLAMGGLLLFILFYIALGITFGLITYHGVQKINHGYFNLFHVLITGCAFVLTVFMTKSLFAVRRAGNPGGIEITAEQEPKLFHFLHSLADEIGAPRPHRVFITPEVNAAVFYDLSLLNLIFPSKKNLIIGLGLVNVLNLGELKAVLAHEFGHFAQNSMMVGRWVYIAQQIIGHMVATRDWLDSIVRFISRIDIRIAFIGWILGLIIWAIRSMVDTLFRLVIIAERALSREMELNADLVAVSVTGSDALVNALYKLQAADQAWQTALDVASYENNQGYRLEDLFVLQKEAIVQIQRVMNDPQFGQVPQRNEDIEPAAHRIFEEMTARPPQMWSTHPFNGDREKNAKAYYVDASIDPRDAWDVFTDAAALRNAISTSFYPQENRDKLNIKSATEAMAASFSHAYYDPQYRGTYLHHNPFRGVESLDTMLAQAKVNSDLSLALTALYPDSLRATLEASRNLEIEKHTLEALAKGSLKPSGGVIRHRGEEIKKSDIPAIIQQLNAEIRMVNKVLLQHDADCRATHQAIATQLGNGWEHYHHSLIQVLHCITHLSASIGNEQALLVNTWQVITADGSVGHFEKKRILRVAKTTHEVIKKVAATVDGLTLPQPLLTTLNIKSWADDVPKYELPAPDKKNWPQWCEAASQQMAIYSGFFDIINQVLLNDLVTTEAKLSSHFVANNPIEAAPDTFSCPAQYPLLLPGSEHVLQGKLDLWNRFQLAQGVMPSTARLLIAGGIVGGTIYMGVLMSML